VRCFNCNNNDWENVDKYRIKPHGMCICKNCGVVSYPSKWQKKEDIIKHYRQAYRKPPTHNNVFTGQRKNHFHHAFLHETFEQWKKEGLQPKICEIGAAFGFALNWFRGVLPGCEIYGTELTTSFKRVAKHEFGIELKDDIDESIKYDMIMSYKVLEHQLDPDIELSRYYNCLSDDGLLYMSVPTWFDTMENFGLGGFDLEYYYDPNHINVWTREIFEGLLKRAGFEIIKKDYIIYGATYLCKKGTPCEYVHKEVSSEICSKLEKIQKAFELFNQGKHLNAIKIYPNYPTAWISYLEFNRKQLADLGWDKFKEQFVEAFIKNCPDSPEAFITATDYAMRAGQLEQAVKYCEAALKSKPENPVSLHAMSNIMREMALKTTDQKEKLHYFIQAREVAHHLAKVSDQHVREATDMIFFYDSQIPYQGE